MLKKVTIFLAPFVLVLAALFVSLKIGIKLESLSLSNLNLSQLYLKLDKKLIFTVKKIKVLNNTKENTESQNIDLEVIHTVLSSLIFFEHIRFEDIEFNNEHLFLEFQNHILSLKHGEGYLKVKFDLQDQFILVDIDAYLKRFDTDLKANITVHNGKNGFFFTNPNLDIELFAKKGDIEIKGDGSLQNNILNFNLGSNSIQDIKPILQYIDLEPKLKEFLEKNLSFSSLKIEHLKGSQNIKGLNKLNLSSLDLKASIDDLNLKYDSYPRLFQKRLDITLKNNIVIIDAKKGEQQKALSFQGFIHSDINGDDITLNGDLYYQDTVLKSYLNYKNDKFDFKISSNRLSNIEFVEDFVKYPKSIKEWIVTRLNAKDYVIDRFSGKIDPNSLKNSLASLRFHLSLYDLNLEFNPKRAYPLQADKAFIEYDGVNMDITFDNSVRSNDVNLQGSSAVIYNMLSFKGDTGIKLNLQSNSKINETLVRVVSSYDIDILKKLALVQIKGKSDIKTVIDIPFGDDPVDVYVKVDTKDAVLSIKEKPIEFAKFDFEYKDKGVFVKDSSAYYEGIHLNVEELTADLKNDLFNLKANTYDDQKRFAIDITDKADFKKKTLQGEFIVKNAFIKDTLEVNNEVLKYSGILDKENDLLDFTIPNLGIEYKKKEGIRTIVFNDLRIFERFVKPLKEGKFTDSKLQIKTKDFNHFDTLLYFKGFIKEKRSYELELASKIDLEKKASIGELFIKDLHYDDILAANNLKLPYNLDYKEGIVLKLPSLSGEYKYMNDTHSIDIAHFEKLENLIKPLQEHKLLKGAIKASTKDFKDISANIDIDFLEFEVFKDTQKLDGMEFFIDVKDRQTITIKDKTQMFNSSIKLGENPELELFVNNLGIVYKDADKEEKKSKAKTCKYIDLDLPKITVELKNGYIKYNDNELLYDKAALNAYKSKIDFSLDQESTNIQFKVDKDKVSLNANMIDKVFVNKLIGKKLIDDGTIELDLYGSQCLLAGNMIFNDVNFKDAAILNQLFLVINAAPATLNPFLILPSAYRLATDGLGLEEYKVKAGFINLEFNRFQNSLSIKEMELVGAHNDFKGRGNIYLTPKLLDLDIDVVFMKDFSKIVGYIPVIGYWLLGDDKNISYTVDVKGLYSDPEVTTHMTRETFDAPVNIIKRIITYPAKLAEDYAESLEDEEEPINKKTPARKEEEQEEE